MILFNSVLPCFILSYPINHIGQLKEELVTSAMRHIMDYTCVKFVLRQNNETDYLDITSEEG